MDKIWKKEIENTECVRYTIEMSTFHEFSDFLKCNPGWRKSHYFFSVQPQTFQLVSLLFRRTYKTYEANSEMPLKNIPKCKYI